MNAKIILLALLGTVTCLRAQVPPAPAGGLTHEEVLRRAAASNAAAATEPAATAASVPDWSATNTSRPATNPATPAVSTAEMAQRLAQVRAAQANQTNRPASLRPPRSTPAPPSFAPAATPTAPPAIIPAAATTPAPDSVTGGLVAPAEMAVRPPASASTIPNPDTIVPAGSIDWPAAPLESVLKIYAEYVGRNLLRPSTLNMKTEIVLKQTTPLTRLEVVQMIEAAMYLNQVSVVNVGEKFVTAVPTAEALKIPGIINTNDVSLMPDLGTIITHVVQLKYVKPQEMMQILTPFASGTSAQPIMPVDSSGILVLRDNVANVKRMLEMIEKVDVIAESEIISEVIPIKYAKAEEIASALSSVGGGTGGTVGTARAATTRSTATGANRPGMGGYNPNQPGGLPGAAPAPVPSSNATFGDRVRNLITRAAGSGDFTILGETKIIADIRSNSLLVFASRRDMDMIKDIISKLDVVLAQVLIETIIMDVSLGNDLTLGVTAGQRPKTNGDVTSGGFFNNSGQLGSLENFLNNIASTNGIFPTGSGLNYFGKFNDDLFVAVTALAGDSRVNVIQKPRIQTSHATPASLFVGETVPYINSTYYGGGFGGGPSSSYSQLRVGIQLSVTPFINQDGLVVMTIEETIDEIAGTVTIDNNPVPATTSRTLSAEVAVRDRETIILGGFIRNSDNKSKSGVPLLKDIPLLGALFRSSSSNKARKELIVLMRPTVLRTPEAAALQVDVEKQRLPGVVAAEKQLDRVELDKAREEAKQRQTPRATAPADFNQVTPFTTEEEHLLLGPAPAP